MITYHYRNKKLDIKVERGKEYTRGYYKEQGFVPDSKASEMVKGFVFFHLHHECETNFEEEIVCVCIYLTVVLRGLGLHCLYICTYQTFP